MPTTRDALHRLTERAAQIESTARASVARDVPSPCLSVCRMDMASGLCEGCLRTLDEIAGWSRADDEAKRRIWQAIDARARPGLRAFTE